MRSLRSEELKKLRLMAIKRDIDQLRVGIYARKSREDISNASLDTQIEECTKFIFENKNILKLDEVDVHKEDNVSGMYLEKRDELEKLLVKLETNQIDIIISSKSDRISRSLPNMSLIIQRIEKVDGYLILGDDLGDNSAAGVFMKHVMLATNEFQVRRSAEDLMKVHSRLVEKGYTVGGPGNYGYDVIDRKYVINPEEGIVVDLVFEMFLNGSSYSQIKNELSNKGYKSRTDKRFSDSTINSILTNKRNCGISIWNSHEKRKKRDRVLKELFDEVVSNDVVLEPIISKEKFNRVQEVMSSRKIGTKGGRNTSYMLTGLIKCSECGSSMTGNSQRSGRNKTKHSTYQCRNHLKKNGSTCSTKHINTTYIEKYLMSHISIIINNELTKLGIDSELVNNLISSQQSSVSRLKRELTKLNDRLEKMTIALYDSISESVRNSTVKVIDHTTLLIDKTNEALTRKIKELKHLSEILINQKIGFSIEDLFSNKELGRRLIYTLVDKIEINNEDIKVTLK